jgi:plasmid stabilization system protein ParE
MNLRWDPRAVRDLREIRDYISVHGSPAAANRVRKHLLKRAGLLRTSPFLGARTSNPEIHLLAPTRYPYRIYYTVQGSEVIILHIRHTARPAPQDLEP